MQLPRSSGILLHITSLDNEFGIGDLGEGAYRFIDFLQRSGQTLWQLLPLGPSAAENSPYSCYSAFAANPLLISPTDLQRRGLLTTAEVESLHAAAGPVDYGTVNKQRFEMLRTSFERFKSPVGDPLREGFATFCALNQTWLVDFARYKALTDHFGIGDWSQWPDRDLVARRDAALEHWDRELAEPIEFAKYLQFLFMLQWQALKSYAGEHGVRIFGDMPIFVAYDSADVWAHQDLFYLDEAGKRSVVAGVPPDYFSATGQLWGNPLYRWDAMQERGYEWWIDRLQSAFCYFDLLRIDHFRAFEAYWEIPADAETAVDGVWVPGPMDGPFRAARAALGPLPIIAEDLGLITDEVHHLRDQLEFPGMRVLQFGFDSYDDPYHRPVSYPQQSVAYTGTHDNDTVLGWFQQRRQERHEDPLLDEVIDLNDPLPHRALIYVVLASKSDTAIVPMQDVLGLGSEARMNVPGEAAGNWTWRCPPNGLNEDVSGWLRHMTEVTGRI
ncbi:4-alpha-glucanotransferase [Rosistilla carotiformis]|uniref:4-alpha-glucanotransferase n=1 Tax=Rosistilla carotiformis TaxID=2528017 RepID=A0A518JXD4_9BACT|nr:4-alpha-glucanotransferase [Rosistilla carotiformis]QDV70202.1 4-alpha-glucanotransferase [Rosistilla carotiformis]